MRDTTWKEFNKNDLSHSGAHYLMAIHEIFEEQGYARLIDVATKLNISKGSLSTSLKPLIKKGLIVEDSHKHLTLSATGREAAQKIQNTHSIVKHFLTHILNIDETTADIDACKIEHLLSKSSSSGLLKLVKALENNPALKKSLEKDLHKYEDCSLKGCKKCNSEKCCIN